MRRAIQRCAAAFLLTLIAACGAKTGLPVPEPDECVSLSATAPIADLDVFTMMDASGSMENVTADGTPKWQAIRQALAAFLLDPGSAGIGAAITFFPVVDPAVPALCVDESACGVPDACEKYSFCFPSGVDFCDTDADCAALGSPEDTCTPLGFCQDEPGQACLLSDGTGCGAGQGLCVDAGLCDNHYDCKTDTYVTPAVKVSKLPGGAEAILDSIDSRVPDGGTTTLPALEGAIQAAKTWAETNPGHKAIVVLATDGLPTNCDPAIKNDMPELAIQHLVDVAAEGAKNGVQTFVIGVFNPDEQAEAAPNLDAIAAGGGTESAFVISTEGDVTKALIEALNEVRITSKSCEFAIPLIDGQLPDLSLLTVRITPPGGQPVTLKRRLSAGGCDPVEGGFYYDKELGGPEPPGRVILCAESCALFGDAQNRTVELQVSCE